jgi:monothiol glutaredoxin
MDEENMRNVLDSGRIHPSVSALIEGYHASTVGEVETAITTNAVVVVGMKGNPFVKKARRLLEAAGTRFAYLEYGSYLGEWRRRSALKMWSGWPTFPMVFVKGTLIGGANDLKALLDSGELKSMLA